MKFVSTRGRAPAIGFEDVLLSGPAPDGGLYVPEAWPRIDTAKLAVAKLSHADLTAAIVGLFADEPEWQESLQHVARRAYARFDDPRVTPLRPLSPHRWLLELFHGPTLAFKDLALQLLGPLMNDALARRKSRALVVAATSGDTGAAAVAALAGQPNIDLVVLHPKGRISDVQRRQMTTAKEQNVRNIALEGTFDDAQALVKKLFADAEFAKKHRLAAINSINWVRIAAQASYYVSTCIELDRGPLTFAVPTGNFGDVFAGYVAKQLGAPIKRLVVATNSNDILARAIETGTYARGRVHATLSPAMDIQVASNFERLLYESAKRDPAVVRALMEAFAANGALTLAPDALARVRELFTADRVSEAETVATMRRVYEETKIVLDPHTAVGVTATRKCAPDENVVTLATAHPAKFPEAVEQATGTTPDLPERLRWILTAPERVDTLPNDLDALKRYLTASKT